MKINWFLKKPYGGVSRCISWEGGAIIPSFCPHQDPISPYPPPLYTPQVDMYINDRLSLTFNVVFVVLLEMIEHINKKLNNIISKLEQETNKKDIR